MSKPLIEITRTCQVTVTAGGETARIVLGDVSLVVVNRQGVGQMYINLHADGTGETRIVEVDGTRHTGRLEVVPAWCQFLVGP